MAERKASDFYPTPTGAITPLMYDMTRAGEAERWGRILDLGCGDGRLAFAAAEAYHYANDAPYGDPYLSGVELDPERAAEAVRLGMHFVWQGDLMDHEDIAAEEPDLIIANPAFSLAQEFLGTALGIRYANGPTPERVVARRPTVAFLLRLNFMGSKKRHGFWTGHERPNLRVLSERPSFTDGGTDMTDYAWYIWSDTEMAPLDWYLD